MVRGMVDKCTINLTSFYLSVADDAASRGFGQPSGTCIWPKHEVHGAQARHSLATLMVQARDKAQPHAALRCASACSHASGHAAALTLLSLHACTVTCALSSMQNMLKVTKWHMACSSMTSCMRQHATDEKRRFELQHNFSAQCAHSPPGAFVQLQRGRPQAAACGEANSAERPSSTRGTRGPTKMRCRCTRGSSAPSSRNAGHWRASLSAPGRRH